MVLTSHTSAKGSVMAKTPEKIEKTSEADPIHAAIANLQESGLGSLAWMGTAWTESMSNLGSEIISFVADRIQEDVKTQHELLHCKSMTVLMRVWRSGVVDKQRGANGS